jgi:plasmid stabilization system protein ParE
MVTSKSYQVIWDKNALQHLNEILNYISKQSDHAPKIVKEGILSKLNAIKTNPFICETDKLKDSLNKNFRAFVIYSYRITYQVKTEAREIRIIRIRHISREPLGY